MDFLKVAYRFSKKDGPPEIYPTFVVKTSKDLMIRGGDFYAIWDDRRGVWTTREDDVIDLIDRELDIFKEKNKETLGSAVVQYMWNSDTGMIDKWHKYVQKQMRDNFHALDEKLVFQNSPVCKEDYASKRLPYSLEDGNIDAYEELISTLYSPSERHKIEWAIGAVVSGDSKIIQKFLVFYGSAGTGKSTILNIIQMLFDGYYSMFDAKSLGSGNNDFALESFKSNPLVAIQHDGDLSKIEDNTRLNSIVSHEEMTVNAKFEKLYVSRFHSMLFMGTNKPVRITDSKSGIIRRLIDVSPTENKVPAKRYYEIMNQIKFELGGIAYHCLQVYESDKSAYDDYIPKSMIGATNDFYNFLEERIDELIKEDSITLGEAWPAYKTYCEEAKVPYPYMKRVFKEELKTYFRHFEERTRDVNGNSLRNYYSGFKYEKFGYSQEDIYGNEFLNVAGQENDITKIGKDAISAPETIGTIGAAGIIAAAVASSNDIPYWLNFAKQESIFDEEAKDFPAQYATSDGVPAEKWDNVTTTLKDIKTGKLHYVMLPKNELGQSHIVIDFDIRGDDGKKSLKKNLEAASHWPQTYAELSKSGTGIHLHYLYSGDAENLSRVYSEQIEVKVFTGKSSLRRKLTKCNNIPIATITSGLPFKEERRVVNFEGVKNEKAIRTIIRKAINKEYEPYATKTSIDLIFKTLDDAYNSGVSYDVTNLRPAVLSFAAKSTHNSSYCIKMVNNMKFASEDASSNADFEDDTIIFFDVEVFQNLFVVVWKAQNSPCVKMINPSPKDIEELIRHKLVGFNNRRYDNHILYGRLIGYSNEKLFELSQRIISGSPNAFFGEAYNLSYTDIYDFSSKKKSLKKWEIELDIHHQELGLPWDEPVPEELWGKVADYCVNDVVATEAVFNHLKADFIARQILADIAKQLTGSATVNDTTNQLTTKIIFRGNKKPQSEFVYTDLSTIFPGYTYTPESKEHKSFYRGEDPKEGGYVYSEPGIYTDVALLDIASMHPTSIEQLNLFGSYTKNFSDIKSARVLIKHGDFDTAKQMFNGALAPYLDDRDNADALAYALKIAINSVYGLTSAKFDNPFRDPRNKDNIVAKRGALFMINLKHEIQDMGYSVAHIKTDSIKIPNATPEVISFVVEYGKQYGYSFEHEATYDRMCLVNDAVYIAKYASIDKCISLYGKAYVESSKDILKDNKKYLDSWTATGTQFQVPYVFKTLFSHEPIEFKDLCEAKTVTSALYLDMNEDLPDVSEAEKELAKILKSEDDSDEKNQRIESLKNLIAMGHNYIFVGKAGSFCPVVDGAGGGILCREQNGSYNAATGSKGYRWMESEMVKELGKEDQIDHRYYRAMVDEAVASISEYGDFEWFVN